MKLMTMENIFLKAGLNWNSMEKNVPYDVNDKNIMVKSFNHKENKNEFKKILNLIRKDDAYIYHLLTKSGDVILKCSGGHRIWDEKAKKYFSINEIESGVAMNSAGEKVEFFVKETDEVLPIVDMEVEDNSNYFTNGLLSHNTTSGGKALQFYASIRLKLSKVGVIEEGSGDDKEKTSVRTRVEAVKNKTFPPFRKAEYVVVFGKGIDNDAGILDTAIENNIVLKKGGWYSIDGINVAQGLVNLKQYMVDNPGVYAEIKGKVESLNKAHVELVVEQEHEQVQDAETMSDEDIANSIEDDTETGSV